MINLLADEYNPLFENDEKALRANFTNNLRWLYIELYDAGRVCNVKEFACQCGVPQSTAESWLRKGVVPYPAKRRLMEERFGREGGSLMRDTRDTIADWPKEYYKRNAAKPSLRTYAAEGEEPLAVAESCSCYGRNAERDLLQICHELVRQEELLAANENLRKIVEAWVKTES